MFPGEQIKRTIIYDMLLIFIVFLHQIKRLSYPYPTLKKLRVHSQGHIEAFYRIHTLEGSLEVLPKWVLTWGGKAQAENGLRAFHRGKMSF